MNTRILSPLLRSTARAITWRPAAAGAVLGAAILLVPEALSARLTATHLTTLARIAAICVALGAAFLLDDPATRSTSAVPVPRLARNLVRAAVAGPAVALWWALTLGLARTTGHHEAAAHLPVAALTLEAATLPVAALALAAVAQRRTTDGNTGVVAAPALLLLAAVAWFLPHPAALLLTPADPGWEASHHRWAAVLAAALVAFLWAGHERPRLPRVWRLTAVAVSVLLVGAGTASAFRGDGERAAAPPLGSVETGTHAWEQIVPGGECRCADGGTFSFWERRADPARVVLFLNGGGVCWDATMCAFTSTGQPGENAFYDWNDQGGQRPYDQRSGFFDLTRAGNPFAGYSIIYVSSCTGDAHLGDVARTYSPTLTVQHRGYVNGTAALAHLATHYPDAAQVVVIGKTAGSIAAPLYGGLVADRLPHAKVTVFGAQSGAWPGDPGFNAKVLGRAWGAYDAAPAWATDGLTVRGWGIPRFWVQAARHAPDLVLARFDYAFDPAAAVEATRWMPGDPPDLLAVIDANEAAIEAAGVTLHSYTAPGAAHGLFEFDRFYDLEVRGVHLVDWLGRLTTGEPPGDVHCGDCRR
ncbi:pectinacetylesterase family protein [Sphaerisporangium corydalis]|uniref:Pectin acetylesterase-family hydrolase n=1 Tax=Sphaerisporangium corydalis TaxID=1441875 RepID=A0ABV9EPS8_9ACTN|nr:pectinacetylesterase family protein [Sphaerisporangium corydalis]